MATIDKSICALCTFEEKCKRIKHCGSNELAINVKKAMIDKAQDTLYGLANDLGCDLLDIDKAKEYIRKAMEE